MEKWIGCFFLFKTTLAYTVVFNFTLTFSLAFQGKKKTKKRFLLQNKNNVNLVIKKLTGLKWVCVNAVNNAFN